MLPDVRGASTRARAAGGSAIGYDDGHGWWCLHEQAKRRTHARGSATTWPNDRQPTLTQPERFVNAANDRRISSQRSGKPTPRTATPSNASSMLAGPRGNASTGASSNAIG